MYYFWISIVEFNKGITLVIIFYYDFSEHRSKVIYKILFYKNSLQ